MDPSALVFGGIGKLKRWVAQYAHGSTTVVFHVPQYTLAELDFLKKVYNPLISSNARESVRFLDLHVTSDMLTVGNVRTLGGQSSSLRDDNSTAAPASSANVRFAISGEDESGPDWRTACRYKKRSPLVKELPKYDESGKIGVYGMKIAGGFSSDPTVSKSKPDFLDPFAQFEQYGNGAQLYDSDYDWDSFQNDPEVDVSKTFTHSGNSIENDFGSAEQTELDSSAKAKIPHNLKRLIQYVIQKHYIDNKKLKKDKKLRWFVISEEPITNTWLRSFGLNVIDLFTAEKLIAGQLTVQQALAKSAPAPASEGDAEEEDDEDELAEAEAEAEAEEEEIHMMFDSTIGKFVRADEFKGVGIRGARRNRKR